MLLDDDQTRYHRTFWHNESNDDLKIYELTTLTYGTAPTSFIATRCLKHLAHQESEAFPLAHIPVRRDFYMDDLLSGADSLEDAKITKKQIRQLLDRGCFPLDKWQVNNKELLEPLMISNETLSLNLDNTSVTRILGVVWNSTDDTIRSNIDTSLISNA